jgi:putative FmdB family regulatory protein
MPTYAYACTACDHRFEAVQSFSDDALTACPECEGRLRKVFGAVGVVFKGSGFYRTDSRSASAKGSSNGSAAKESAKASGDSSSAKPAKESSTPSAGSSSASSPAA